jgi:two-component system response regulator VicR
MVSAKDSESDKIVGLEMGADDYITKPFQIRELMARIKANLRKADAKVTVAQNELEEKEDKVHKENKESEIIQVGELSLDLKKVEARVKGEIVNLTKKEFDVLRFLASQPGEVVTRERLLHEIWEYDEYVGAIRTIDVTMNRIREKIEKDKADPKILITKRGVGYYIADSDNK